LKPVIQGIAIEQDVNSELNFVKQSLLSRAHLQKIVNETGLGARVSNQQAMARVLDRNRSLKVVQSYCWPHSPAAPVRRT